jgi:hypothetical protein
MAAEAPPPDMFSNMSKRQRTDVMSFREPRRLDKTPPELDEFPHLEWEPEYELDCLISVYEDLNAMFVSLRRGMIDLRFSPANTVTRPAPLPRQLQNTMLPVIEHLLQAIAVLGSRIRAFRARS